MDIWTEEDERKLQDMVTRKKQTFEEARTKLLVFMKTILPKYNGSTYAGYYSPGDVADALIRHGGAFRDALLPFDHMGRPTPSVEVTALGDETKVVEPVWLDHKPGPMPVTEDAIVEVRFRDGTQESGSAGAYAWYEWGNTTIVAYRVIG